MVKAFAYSTKMWVTTILAMTILFIPIGLIIHFNKIYHSDGNIPDTISFLFMMFFMGLIMSSPAWLIFTFMTAAVERIPMRIISKKITLAVILWVEIYLTFLAFGMDQGTMFPTTFWSATLAIVLTAMLIRPPDNPDLISE